MFGLALHGIIDDLEIYLYYNVFWLALSNSFYKKVQLNKDNILSERIIRIKEKRI